MKWYWIVLIVLVSLIIGYWLSKQRQKTEPIKANTERIVADLQAELDSINNWLSGRPNESDPNYAIQKAKYNARATEILGALKSIYGCTLAINITKGSKGEYVYNCNDIVSSQS